MSVSGKKKGKQPSTPSAATPTQSSDVSVNGQTVSPAEVERLNVEVTKQVRHTHL